MPIRKWREEADEAKKEAVFQDSFDELVDEIMAPMQFKLSDESVESESWRSKISTESFTPVVNGNILTIHRKNVPLDEVADLEKTYRAVKDAVSDTDELDYVLNESFDYYSDRRVHLEKRGGYNELSGPVYQHQKHRGGRGSSRNHAGMRNNFQSRY
jgi:hypothetical protein